eukprot:CAMPEP_0170571338 /NCGR_PEP_ID=MMETSP0224-20130122/1620_1 /TAXON_ID=285029 /ORGANISM="Togula jolla, Strain CCCM 725" /LENGTH=194 /DNA_ID=CAMNT_0010893735 /DNA_START=1030 /DNA_END=1615 /DNA_ORIENTATION=-
MSDQKEATLLQHTFLQVAPESPPDPELGMLLGLRPRRRLPDGHGVNLHIASFAVAAELIEGPVACLWLNLPHAARTEDLPQGQVDDQAAAMNLNALEGSLDATQEWRGHHGHRGCVFRCGQEIQAAQAKASYAYSRATDRASCRPASESGGSSGQRWKSWLDNHWLPKTASARSACRRTAACIAMAPEVLTAPS